MTRVFSPEKAFSKDERSKTIQNDDIKRIMQDKADQIKIIKNEVKEKVFALLKNKKLVKRVTDPKSDKVGSGKR